MRTINRAAVRSQIRSQAVGRPRMQTVQGIPRSPVQFFSPRRDFWWWYNPGLPTQVYQWYYRTPNYYYYSPRYYRPTIPDVRPSALLDPSQVEASPVASATIETPQPVTIRVVAPPDAQIWIDGTHKPSTGAVREFHTKELEPGEYSFVVHAQWQENGQPVSQTQEVTAEPGDAPEFHFPYRKSNRD